MGGDGVFEKCGLVGNMSAGNVDEVSQGGLADLSLIVEIRVTKTLLD